MGTRPVPARLLLKNVLYATDFSERSAPALPYALAIARKYHHHCRRRNIRRRQCNDLTGQRRAIVDSPLTPPWRWTPTD
jgi:hypothetical protein